MSHSIVLIEDDEGLQKYIRELLLENGYSVSVASTGVAARDLITKVNPDLILLDLGLPDISGETLCAEIKKNHPHLPVIILTAKSGVENVVQGLDLGADDYITKPFIADELLARMKARLRQNGQTETKLKIADLELDTETLEVKRDTKDIQLTPQEFRLLQYLMSNTNRVLTREMILNRLWLSSPDIETRVVDVYIGYLRKKIDSGFDKKLIHSVRGFGYTIKE
jgi:DNA-binding response OmpR family regulator